MNKKINIVLGVSFIIFSLLVFWIYYSLKNDVGDIKYDSNVDSGSFMVCDADKTFQYYYAGTKYMGERKAIRDEILSSLKTQSLSLENKSGYITIRFSVNCKGEAGMYRLLQIDENYSETTFNDTEVDKLITTVSELKNWKAGSLNDTPVDSYYQIHFKIKKGRIEDIF